MGVGTLYLPPPPPVRSRNPSRARSDWNLQRRGGGGGGEDQGIVGPPSIPLSPGAAPKKKGTGGRGVEGGVISPISNPPLAPTRAHPFHRQKNPKSLWFGWEREGGRGGGAILIIIRPRWLRGQALLASDLFFGGEGKDRNSADYFQ